MNDRQSREFLQEAIERRYSRREILQRAAAVLAEISVRAEFPAVHDGVGIAGRP